MHDSETFVVLSGILPRLLLPLPLACMLLGLGLLRRAPGRALRAALFAALALLWLGGTRLVSEPLGRSLEWRYLPPADLPAADRIVVLGAATEPRVAPRREVGLGEGADRLLHAARLWRAGKAPGVLLCGGRAPGAAGAESEAADMAQVLELLGVPAAAIQQESRSRNTYENALEARRLLEPQGVRRILLVTSALHMPRAVGLFRHQGFEVIPAPADIRMLDPRARAEAPLLTRITSWVIPDAETLAYTTRALHEYMGIAAYRVMGRLD